jgi:hypothetical protein
MDMNCTKCQKKMDEVFSADLKIRKGWFCAKCFFENGDFFTKSIGRERKNESRKR